MTDPFVGARAKIARAHEHLDELYDDIDRFLEAEADVAVDAGLVTDLKPERGEYNVDWVGDATPPVEWAVRVGEFFYNLRSALDHIAHYLSGGREKSQFPIFHDKDTFEANARTSGMTRDAVTVIKSLQPFSESPNDPKRTPMWAIHHLCVVDKHRLLNLTELWATDAGARWELPVPVDQVITTHYTVARTRLEPNTPLVRQTFNPAVMRALRARARQGHMGVEYDVLLEVVLAEGEWLVGHGALGEGVGVRDIMQTALDHVVMRVLPAFERFA